MRKPFNPHDWLKGSPAQQKPEATDEVWDKIRREYYGPEIHLETRQEEGGAL